MKASIKSCKYKMWVVWPTVPRIHDRIINDQNEVAENLMNFLLM